MSCQAPLPFFKIWLNTQPPSSLKKEGRYQLCKHSLNSVPKLDNLSYFLSKLCIFGMDVSKNKANITTEDYD